MQKTPNSSQKASHSVPPQTNLQKGPVNAGKSALNSRTGTFSKPSQKVCRIESPCHASVLAVVFTEGLLSFFGRALNSNSNCFLRCFFHVGPVC